jgi:isocitrate/isopropylmalate dehydrogenase
MGAILSAAMLLDSVGRQEESRRLEEAVAACVRDSETTRDLGGTLSTSEVGQAIRARIGGRRPGRS